MSGVSLWFHGSWVPQSRATEIFINFQTERERRLLKTFSEKRYNITIYAKLIIPTARLFASDPTEYIIIKYYLSSNILSPIREKKRLKSVYFILLIKLKKKKKNTFEKLCPISHISILEYIQWIWRYKSQFRPCIRLISCAQHAQDRGLV